MSCISLTITPVEPSVLSVTPAEGTSVTILPATPATLTVTPAEPAQLTIMPSPLASVSSTPVEGAQLTIGKVCSISGGDMYVLAASDGPLRTRDGGFFLLNPATIRTGS